MVIYEYDEKKSKTNFKKHGVSFEEAATVFFDPLVRIVRVESQEEERFRAIGQSAKARLLLVVYCERGFSRNNEEIIRLISARKLTRPEKKYLERLRR